MHKSFMARCYEMPSPSHHTFRPILCCSFFGTSALVESVFSIQGLGIYLTKSCESMDIYGISGSIPVCGVLFVLFNTLADLLSSAICPAYRRKAA